VDRSVNESFKFNLETEFVPILGQVASQLNEGGKESGSINASSVQENHHPILLSILASELGVKPEEIHDFELYVRSVASPNPRS
jgi:aspartyl aminopeptidase